VEDANTGMLYSYGTFVFLVLVSVFWIKSIFKYAGIGSVQYYCVNLLFSKMHCFLLLLFHIIVLYISFSVVL